MNKVALTNLDLDLYSETLENGLTIFVIPKQNCNNIYVTFTTKYGSIQNEFIPYGKEEMIKVPEGVAHFLEHKLFEQKDGVDPFTFFGKNGASSNASTSSYKTIYLFEGPSYFKENIEYLLDFVQDPYFTDENVEKEKGIIIQEIKMYQDNPFRMGYERSLFNTFQKNSIRYPVGGSEESVNSITKEDLYTCYETFYHPSNMFIVVTGNVNPEETIDIVRENQKKKNFKEAHPIEIKEYDEPNEVGKPKETLKMNVAIPKLMLNFKFNIEKMTMVEDKWLLTYLSVFADLKLGPTSTFQKELLDENLITEPLDFYVAYTKTHAVLMITAESKKTDIVEKKIKEEIGKDDILEEDFERKKKTLIASAIFASDNIYRMNNKVINDVLLLGYVNPDDYNRYRGMSFDTLKQIMDCLDYSYTSTVVIEPKSLD